MKPIRHTECIIRLTFSAFIAICCTPVVGQALESGDPGFGWQWVRQNPFTIQATNVNLPTWDFAEYAGAGFTVLQWLPHNPFSLLTRASVPASANMPWHGYVFDEGGLFPGQTSAVPMGPGLTGMIVSDEPSHLTMPGVATLLQSKRQQSPAPEKIILYSTALPLEASLTAADYWGDHSNPSYTYSQYLDDFISIIKPDVLLYDHYPFFSGGSTSSSYLSNVAIVRTKAIANNLPYWGWLQAFPNGSRWPSESDNRFNVYTHLTMGFTGLSYWTYDSSPFTGDALIDADGNRTPLYHFVKQTNAEAANLGKSLRFLTSTDVRFLPGRNSAFGSPHSTPAGLSNWTAGAGGDPHLLSAAVNTAQAVNRGTGKDGLIGFFTDDDGQHYFMLANLYHGANLSADAAALSFVITFDNSVDSIWRLNRLTGLPEKVALSNHVLTWTLPGGTGDLFKYSNENFVGVPEPSGNLLAIMGVTSLFWFRRCARTARIGIASDLRTRHRQRR